MSLFRITETGLIPFDLVAGDSMVGEQVDHDLAQALWSDLDVASGQRLFPVRRGDIGDDSPPPVMLALDVSGALVLLYARAIIGTSQLAECLEQLGWARGVTVGELSSIYWRGADEFWEDWEDFSGTPTPAALSEGTGHPRVVFVSTKVAASTESALQFLADSGVPVTILRAALYSDDHGCQLLELRDLQAAASAAKDGQTRGSEGLADSNGAHSAAEEVPRRKPSQSSHPDVQRPRRSSASDGRNIDVGGMTRIAADELFAGGEPKPAEGQSRFARPLVRKSANGQPGSVSPLRRRVSPVENYDVAEPASNGRDLGPLLGRREDRESAEPPQLAPLRFTSDLVEPQLPAELMEPRSLSEFSERLG